MKQDFEFKCGWGGEEKIYQKLLLPQNKAYDFSEREKRGGSAAKGKGENELPFLRSEEISEGKKLRMGMQQPWYKSLVKQSFEFWR